MAERIIIAASISILTFLVLAAIFVVDITSRTDDVFLPLSCLVGASIILAKVEPRGGILCHVTVFLFYIHLVVQVLFFGETKASMLSVFFGVGLLVLWLHSVYLQHKTETKESARTFFYRATWFVFGFTLFLAILWVIFLAIDVGDGSAVIEKDDILQGLETICFVVLAVSNWFVAMEDQIPISLEDNSDEHKKDEELQAYESMT